MNFSVVWMSKALGSVVYLQGALSTCVAQPWDPCSHP